MRDRPPICRFLLLLLALAGMVRAAQAAEPPSQLFIYQHDVGAGDDRNEYEQRVLRVALDHTRQTWGPYELRASAPMPGKHRIFVLEHREGGVNIGLFVAQSRLDDHLIPVKIPVDRGMLGYRVLVIRAADQPRFDSMESLDDLKAVRLGLLAWWEDVPILRHSGLKVVSGSSFAGMFHMLSANRFDALSRGAGEVGPEMTDHSASSPDLAIERHLLLHYPMPVYFWFPNTPEGRKRADRVREGLQIMQLDGSLETLFQQEFGPAISRLDLDHRQIIEIPNPLLDGKDPLDDPALWYRPH